MTDSLAASARSSTTRFSANIAPPLVFALSLWAMTAFGQPAVEVVEVIGQTPLGGGIDTASIASNVQSATSEDLEAQRAVDLSDYMKRNLASVFVNEAQSNPLQPDVQYRGFVGSPLLGLPQGIAVYQDGVRLNEPFGDTINWALIPQAAIASIHLMPGSNPLFGLNALGGAISIRTKNGFDSDRSRIEAYTGSFGRNGASFETGGQKGGRLAYFITGTYFEEDGWRDFSPSDALQFFGNTAWQTDVSSLTLNVALADTTLIGNGPVPVELMVRSRREIFTRPDWTKNSLGLVNLVGERSLSDTLTLTGNVYLRNSDIDSLNGDDAEFEACEGFQAAFLCEDEDGMEQPVLDAAGNPVVATDAVTGAAINRTGTEQGSAGFGFQATWNSGSVARGNTLVVGISFDDSSVDFASSTELGSLDASRAAVPSGTFVGSSFTDLRADASNVGLYLSDTVQLTNTLALTVSGRFNRTRTVLRDRLGTALDGDHRFSRFNPALGITAALNERLGFYANLSASNRVPSPVELTCADPDDPCRLPNAFLADPPLDQVVAETFELGFRGDWARGNWHAGAFRTTNSDDILFISAGALTNQGYFDNVGRTRRDGLEMDVSGSMGIGVDWFANLTFLDATFRQSLRFPSPHNPAAIDGEVAVWQGDRLPLVPDRLFKAGLSHAITSRVSWGADLQAALGFHLRGDEGNDLDEIGEFVVVNLRADYAVSDRFLLFINVSNVFGRDYETFGLLGEPDDVLGDEFSDNRFLSPAMPRAAWIGIRADF